MLNYVVCIRQQKEFPTWYNVFNMFSNHKQGKQKQNIYGGINKKLRSICKLIYVHICHSYLNTGCNHLTHWGRGAHIYVSKLTIIVSDNGLSPGWHQAIIWTNAGKLLIRTLETNFSEILIEIYIFSFKKMSSGSFCLCLNVLI